MSPQDESAFGGALIAAMPRLMDNARSLAGRQDACDLVQEAATRAWAARERFIPGTNLEAWLVTIMRNYARSQFRHRRHEVEDADERHGLSVSVPETQFSRVLAQDVIELIQRLPMPLRRDFVSTHVEGMSYGEAAAQAGVAVGTIKSRIFRCRQILAAALAEGLGHPDSPAPAAGSERTHAQGEPRRAEHAALKSSPQQPEA